MHERYLYPAVVFAIPLVFEAPTTLAVFALLTLTGLCNLAEVLHALNAGVFLDAHDPLGMGIALTNLFTFILAAGYAFAHTGETAVTDSVGALRQAPSLVPNQSWVAAVTTLWRPTRARPFRSEADLPPLPWLTVDTVVLVAVVGVAAALRFWNLDHPHEIVFDEVHFVGQARHYIRGEAFLDPHPPIAKLLIAAGILLFGDHPWSWRLGNAGLGTVMVAVTFLLGRRMFHSRLAAVLAAGLVACDGFFIVDSRIGCIDIVYLTFAAIAYLLLFRFIETPEFKSRRRSLLIMGVVLGLCLGSKLYVPGITFHAIGRTTPNGVRS
jgi:hypothetical protein